MRAALLILMVSACYSQFIPNLEVNIQDPLSTSGYYLIHTIKPGISNPYVNTTLLLDKFGEIVYLKKFSSQAIDYKIHPNGIISYPFTNSGVSNMKYYIMDSTFTVKDSVRCQNGYITDNHEMQILSNGNYLMLGYEFVNMNLSSYHWFNGNGSPGSANASVQCGIIQILDLNKNVLFTWRSAEHYQFSDVQEQWLFSPVLVDWTHFNSVEEDSDGNILVSLRHFSEITKINRQTGAIIWRLGGKRNQFTFLDDPYNGFSGQHDARRITGDDITLFDNGYLNTPVHPARGVEYMINEQNLTATLIWSHNYSGNSSRFLGSMQKLQNGNFVIEWGGLINRNEIFSVVKSSGAPVLSLSVPDTLFSYRATNYSTLPWNLPRPHITCFEENGNHFLDAGEGHSSYLWSNGDISRFTQVTVADTYYVFVPFGTGGYLSSEAVIITDLMNPCGQLTGYSGTSVGTVKGFFLEQNYPNPFNPVTKIGFSIPRPGKVKITVFDASGKKIAVLIDEFLHSGKNEVDWNASAFSSGIYFYRLEAKEFNKTKIMVLLK